MNIASFMAFVSVMETGSVSKAAEKLFLTQPAITKRIANLEQALSIQLFEPIGRGVQPTAAAMTLLPKARQWIGDYEDIKHSLSHANENVSGVLSIGTSHHIGLHHLPASLKKFVQTYPDVQLDVRFIDSEQAHQSVLMGEVELAFLTLPPVLDHRLNYCQLWDDPLVFVCSPFHALAQYGNNQQPQFSQLTLQDLVSYPALLPAAHTYTTQMTLQAFAQHQLKPIATMNTNPLESIRMLVAIGLGWSVLPSTLVNEDLVILPINDIHLVRTLGMVWHPKHTLSKAASMLHHSLSAMAELKA